MEFVNSEASASFLLNRRDRYESVGKISQGNFGQVFIAIDRLTHQRVAIKQQAIPSEQASRELSAYSIFSSHAHQHVMTMLDYFVTGAPRASILHTVHAYMSTTVWHKFKMLDQQLGMPDSNIFKYMKQVAAGLAHMHALGVVHGDASFKNLLLCEDDNIKVSDFGTAFSAANYITNDSEVATCYVRSPEVCLKTREPTLAVDVWAVGVLHLCLRFAGCPWMGVESGDDILGKQIEIFGPITIHNWPHHSLLRGWPEFRKKFGDLNLNLSLPSPAKTPRDPWGHLVSNFPLFKGHEPRQQIKDFTWSLFQWCPEHRPTCFAIVETIHDLVAGLSVAPGPGDVVVPLGELAAQAGHGNSVLAASHGASVDEVGQGDVVVKAGQGASVAEASQGEAGLAPQGCECKGNCGRKVCKRRQTARWRDTLEGAICVEACLQGFRFCWWCKCEARHCVNPRNRSQSMRWCQWHGKHIGSVKLGRYISYEDENEDVDKLCIQKIPVEWPMELRLVARLAFLLPLCVATDFSSLIGIGPQCVPGAAVRPQWICLVFLAQTIKWPGAVHKFIQLNRHKEAIIADDFVAYYNAVLKWSSARDWGHMFERMDSGLQYDQAGLDVNAQAFGLITSEVRKRKRAKTESVICLGPAAGSPYRLAEDISPATRIVQYILTQAGQANLHWPDVGAGVGEVRGFATKLLELATALCCNSDHGLALQPALGKSFARVVLYILEIHQPRVFDEFQVQEIWQWCPDDIKYCDAISAMSVPKCRLRFTGSLLLLPFYTCGMARITSMQQQELYRLSDDRLWEIIQQRDVERSQDSHEFSTLFTVGPQSFLGCC